MLGLLLAVQLGALPGAQVSSLHLLPDEEPMRLVQANGAPAADALRTRIAEIDAELARPAKTSGAHPAAYFVGAGLVLLLGLPATFVVWVAVAFTSSVAGAAWVAGGLLGAVVLGLAAILIVMGVHALGEGDTALAVDRKHREDLSAEKARLEQQLRLQEAAPPSGVSRDAPLPALALFSF